MIIVSAEAVVFGGALATVGVGNLLNPTALMEKGGGGGENAGKGPKISQTGHGKARAEQRGFSDGRIQNIVTNNKGKRVVDETGNVTREFRDPRGNTVVLNSEGSVVTVFSSAKGGKFIPRTPRR